MSQSHAPLRSSLPPPSLPRELLAKTRIHTLREELSAVPDPRTLGMLELELGALHEHGLGERELATDCYLRARHHQPSQLPALFALSRIYTETRAHAQAAEVWQALARKSELAADRAVALCEAGILLYDQLGEREQARELWSEALTVDPGCLAATLLLEQHQRGLGNVKEANRVAAVHAWATTDEELKASMLVELCVAQGREGNDTAARELLAQASLLGASPHALWWQSERFAHGQQQREQLAAALEAFAAALVTRGSARASDGDRAAALLREAARLFAGQASDGQQVIERCDRALLARPGDALVLWERLLAQTRAGHAEAAERDANALLRASADGPLAAAVRVRLAQSLEAQGKPEEALRALRDAVAAEPGSAAGVAFLEDALLRIGRLSELREQLVARAERGQGDARAERLLQAARIARVQKDSAAALSLLQSAEENARRAEPMLRAKHACSVWAGDQRAALAAAAALCTAKIEPAELVFLRFDQYQRLRRGGRDSVEARALLGVALQEPSNASWAPHAARAQAAAARDYPLLAAAHRALAAQAGEDARSAAHSCAAARALLRANEPQAAADELRLALGRAPDDAYALALLEECLLLSGGEREVARLLRESAQTHASEKQRELALLHAGIAAEAIGDVQAAARIYEEAADRDPTSLGPCWALLRLAERSNDAPLAERAQIRLVRREDAVGGGLCHLELGEQRAARGRVSDASQPLSKALDDAEVATAAALGVCLLPSDQCDLALRDRALRSLQEACGDGAALPLMRDGIAAHLRLDPPTGVALLEAALLEHPNDAGLSLQAFSNNGGTQRAEHWQRLARAGDEPNVAAELTLHAMRIALLAAGESASEDGLVRALQCAAQAPESLAAAVALDEMLGAGDDAESRAVALFGRLSYARPETSRPLRAARARALLAAGRAREAADAARRALGEDPADLGALETLRVAGRALGDFPAVADAAQRLAEHAQGRFCAMLLEEAALLFEHELAQPDEAERCLKAALEHDPASELAFARLHDLLLDRRDTNGLLSLLDQRIAGSIEPLARLDLRYERALVLRAAGRKQEAIAALEHVLADDPQNAAAIGLVAETCTALEQWAGAVAALRRLAEANVPMSQKRLARLGAAEFLERRLNDIEGACVELQTLRAEGISDNDVLVRLAGLCERAGRYRQAVDVYREAAAQASFAAAAELERRGGDVLRRHLGASNEAVEAYQRALAAHALDGAACAQLLELTEGEERERILLAFEHALRGALEREPGRPELLRLLRRVGAWRGRKDVELVALSALHALGVADGNEHAEQQALAAEARAHGPTPLNAAPLEGLAAGLAAVKMARIAQLISIALAASDGIAPLTAQIDEAVRSQPAEQRFELGRRAMALLLCVLPLLGRTRAARRDALYAALALGGLAHEAPKHEALGKQLGKQLVRAQRKELSRLAAQLEQPEVQLDAYLDLLDLCLARAGLLLADDLGPALLQVAGSGGGGLESFAGAPRALDLLRFWVSPRLLELRRELGWGP
jgi:tetratricopeptide (TPR) repeat protein